MEEKKNSKVLIIILVLVLICAVAAGIFVFFTNKDKQDNEGNEEKTSQTQENTEEDENVERRFSGELDMSEEAGTEGMKFELTVSGNKEKLNELILRVDMTELMETTYEEAGGEDSGYTYSELVKQMQKAFEGTEEGLAENFTSTIGIKGEATSEFNWEEDTILVITIDCSKLEKDEYIQEETDNVIETIVEQLKDEGIELKENPTTM